MPNARTLAAAALLAAPTLVSADVLLLDQQRLIQAATAADGNISSASASTFAPFVQTVASTATFPAPGGAPGNNTAISTINCIVDPNAISATGSLTAAGGLSIGGAVVLGEAKASVRVDFDVDSVTPFHLVVSPRPSMAPGDEYTLDLEQVSPQRQVFFLDETTPPAAVDLTGTLQPGSYRVRYIVNLTNAAADTTATYDFNLTLGTQPCSPADLGSAGGTVGPDGTLDNNDFIAFITAFFAADARADLGTAGGLAGGDGAFDNNDFIAFITLFFAGC